MVFVKIYKLKNIAILFASYNGKKWIKEQIDSILNQKDVNISIFISDDLSTDGTVAYIKNVYRGCQSATINF